MKANTQTPQVVYTHDGTASSAWAALRECDARNALALGIARLEAAAVPSAAFSAELLLLHVLRRDRTWLYAHPEHAVAASEAAAYERLLQQRTAGVPTQHLTGRQEFWGLDFEVTPDVLIPRPETEHVIEVALARLGSKCSEPLQVAEIGTGSGCLAVALARELPLAQIIATDISAAALAVARRNASRHGEQRIEFKHCDLLECCLPQTSSSDTRPAGVSSSYAPRFDLVVSNPPYIGRNEAAQLAREVREHEPAAALFGGEQGFELYPALIDQASRVLRSGGILVLELGHNSVTHVSPLLLGNSGWNNVAVTMDLAGIPRVIAANRA
jgi:release factor glutamine methyltransferase